MDKKWDKLPKQSLGDIVDRVSILSLKLFHGEERAYKEHTYLTESVTKLKLNLSGALLANIIRLAQTNTMIWELENEIRKSNDPTTEIGLKEVGRRAIIIRDINKKRVIHKNEINRLTGMGFREFKIKHRSQ